MLLKQEVEHDEIFEDTWEARENEWLPYVKNYVLSSAFSYARYTMGMEELTGFGLKNNLTLPGLAIENCNSLKEENDEAIYIYTDPFMRNFVRSSIYSGRCKTFVQHYRSEISDEFLNIISKELNVNGNIRDLLKRYVQFINNYVKLYAKDFDSKNEDYREIYQKEKMDYINKKLNLLPIYEQLSKLDLKNTQMEFEATDFYHSAM